MLRTPAAAAWRFVPTLLTAALLAAVVTGCSSSNTAWKKGQAPKVGTAAATGMYELTSGKQVLARYQIFAGEALGFRKSPETGRVQAVAGLYEVDLTTNKSYTWKMVKPGSDQ